MALVELTRAGNTEAYGELWKRHSAAVTAASRRFTGAAYEDVAQETFLRVFTQIQAGRGPATAFRAYAIATARNVATNMARGRSNDEFLSSDETVFEENAPLQADIGGQVLSDAFTLGVFSSLPVRWQEVLWYRDVEDLPVSEMSVYLGVKDNAASALLKRAREGFKQAWIAASLSPDKILPPECQWAVEKLPQMARKKSSAPIRKRFDAHVSHCAHCSPLVTQSEYLESKLALTLLPGLIGGPAAAGYLAWSQARNAGVAVAAGMGVAQTLTVPVAVVSLTSVVAVSALLLFPLHLGRQTGSNPPIEVEQVARPTDASGPSGGGVVDRSKPAPQPQPDESEEATDNDSIDELQPEVDQDRSEIASEAPEEPEDHGAVAYAAPVALSAAVLDGPERGVYPRLTGQAAPNATIFLTISNDRNQMYEHQISADANGRWVYSPNGLHGQITVSGHQEYLDGTNLVVEPKVDLASQWVGDGLQLQALAISDTETKIQVTGLSGATKNQVVTVVSSTLGTVLLKQPVDSNGEVSLIIHLPRIDVGDLRFWQGDTSEGPRRVWWRATGY